MHEPRDAELWRLAATNDADAFGKLYERHARVVYNYVFRRVGDWSEAEDLTAVVFLEAFRRRREVRLTHGELLPWLYGVATNVVRNRRRAIWRHGRALRRLRPGNDGADHSVEAIERLDAQKQMRHLLELVRRLHADQQDVIALCIWSDLSYEEAAVALGIPVGTVRSRLSRARAALRELLGENRHEIGEPDDAAGKVVL
jgi:RNA polymerase sigma factor (sigma-70 family)